MDLSWRFFRAVARGKSGVRQLSKVISAEPEKFAPSDFKKLLVKMDMPYVDGFTCLESQCKFCSLKSPGNLYINKTTGKFKSHICAYIHNFDSFMSFRTLSNFISHFLYSSPISI